LSFAEGHALIAFVTQLGLLNLGYPRGLPGKGMGPVRFQGEVTGPCSAGSWCSTAV
jgi:hypothetical protein